MGDSPGQGALASMDARAAAEPYSCGACVLVLPGTTARACPARSLRSTAGAREGQARAAARGSAHAGDRGVPLPQAACPLSGFIAPRTWASMKLVIGTWAPSLAAASAGCGSKEERRGRCLVVGRAARAAAAPSLQARHSIAALLQCLGTPHLERQQRRLVDEVRPVLLEQGELAERHLEGRRSASGGHQSQQHDQAHRVQGAVDGGEGFGRGTDDQGTLQFLLLRPTPLATRAQIHRRYRRSARCLQQPWPAPFQRGRQAISHSTRRACGSALQRSDTCGQQPTELAANPNTPAM